MIVETAKQIDQTSGEIGADAQAVRGLAQLVTVDVLAEGTRETNAALVAGICALADRIEMRADHIENLAGSLDVPVLQLAKDVRTPARARS